MQPGRWRIFLWATLVLLAVPSCNWSSGPATETGDRTGSQAPVAISPNQVRPREIYVQLYPRDGYLHIKEYHIESLLPPDAVADQLEAIRNRIAALEYSESEYRFELFDAKEESWFRDRGFITGQYHLKTDETNVLKLIDDSFAKILRRPVKVKITESEIILQFPANGVRVADNNATGVYLHRETNWNRVVFGNDERFYEAVFSLDDSGDQTTSMIEYFPEDVHAEKDPGQ